MKCPQRKDDSEVETEGCESTCYGEGCKYLKECETYLQAKNEENKNKDRSG